MSYSVAIDGPAGAGKSTIAKKIAKRMNYIYVDTGAMYRAMGLYLMRKGIDMTDEEAMSRECKDANITIQYENGEQIIKLDEENVNSLIRSEEAGKMASAVATNGEVREKLVELQRNMAKTTNVIMDGRDIGTCVLPNANLKVYLTAGSAVRAKRRYEELYAKGVPCDIKVIEEDIINRDKQDMSREISPLKQAEDAILVDSSNMTIEEVIQTITALCQFK